MQLCNFFFWIKQNLSKNGSTIKTFFFSPVSKIPGSYSLSGRLFLGERTNLREYRHVPKYLLNNGHKFFFKRRINSEATK